MELTYTKVGDYYIPDLALDNDAEYEIGIYGRMRQRFLEDVNAISKCRFSPKWDVVFYRAAYRCYTALYTTSLAGLKPVKP